MSEQPKIEQEKIPIGATSLKRQVFEKIDAKDFSFMNDLEDILSILPTGWHLEVALKLIKAHQGQEVLANINKFKDLNLDNNFARALIINNEIGFLSAHLEKFSGLDKEIALKLIQEKWGQTVIINLDKFTDFSLDSKFAKYLLANHELPFLALYLGNFRNLDEEVAFKLISVGEDWSVVVQLDSFDMAIHQKIAEKLLESTAGAEIVANYLEKFPGVDHNKLADQLIKANWNRRIAQNLEKFHGLDKEVATQLVKSGWSKEVASNLNHFTSLSNEIVPKLIKAGQGLEVMNNMDYFDGLDHNEVAQAMIEAGQGKFVKLNLDIFTDLSPEMIEKVNNL